jgi:protein-disulfide isomerase
MWQRLRLRRLQLIAGFLALLVAVSTVLGVTRIGSHASSSREPDALGAAGVALERALAGIPQRGMALGDPHAPATLLEFTDPQCPFCAEYAREALPGLIDRWVRTGRLRLELRLLTFIGADSNRAARLIAAAALQDEAWPLSELAFLTQGRENSGYVTATYLRRLARAVPGLDARRALAQRDSRPVDALLGRAAQQARRLGVDATPSFFLLRHGRRPLRLRPRALSFDSVSEAIRSGLTR